MGGPGSGRPPRVRDRTGVRLPPGNDTETTDVETNGTANGTAAPVAASFTTPTPFFPRRSLFPSSRPVGAQGSGSRLPPRQPVQPLASISAVEPMGPKPVAAAPPPPAAPDPSPVAPRPVIPEVRAAPAAPPVRIVGPSQHAAAASNEYQERLSEREAHRYGRRTEVVQPETFLVHAWAFAMTQYPPSALTIWLQSTAPADSPYSFYIRGDELAGDPFPDRKLYETVRLRRKKPQVAESFSGRIRGMSTEGVVLDVGGGFIELPPEQAQPAAQWGPAPGAQGPVPWGYSQTQPGPWGASQPWGGGGGSWGPWGPPPQWGPPPWWMQFSGGQPQQQAPPAAIAHDAVAVELWKGMQEIQSRTMQSSSDAQVEVAKMQNAMMLKLLERASAPAASSSGATSMKDTLGLLGETAKLIKELQGDSGSSGLTIQEVGKDKIFSSGGKLNTELTAGFAIKDGLTDLIKGVAGRMRPPNAAATAVASASGSTLPPKTQAVAAATPKPNGTA